MIKLEDPSGSGNLKVWRVRQESDTIDAKGEENPLFKRNLILIVVRHDSFDIELGLSPIGEIPGSGPP